MNMLTSLKALLFSSTAGRSAVQGATPVGEAGAPDFAAMLSGSIAEAAPSATGEISLPVQPTAQPEEGVVEAAVSPEKLTGVKHAVLQGVHDAPPRGLTIGTVAGKGADASPPPGLALGLIKHGAGPQPLQSDPAPNPVEQAAGPSSPIDVGQSEEGAPLNESAPPEAQLAEGQVSDAVETVAAEPSRASAKPRPAHPAVDQVGPSTKKIAADEIDASAEPAGAPPVDKDEEAPSAKEDSPALTASPASPAVVVETPPTAPAPMTAPETASAPARDRGSKATLEAASGANAIKTQTQQKAVVADAKPAPRETEAPPEDGTASAPTIDGDKPVQAPVLHGKPVKAEAIALLQLVREQVAARQSGASARVGEQVAAVASKRAEQGPATPTTPPDLSLPAAPDMQPQAPVAASQPAPASVAPPVDLSASLGAQVVDMGVSGQWIDGLAREIAGLSANGAQGRFQINANHLGAVQVDIRHGTDGAAVSLTVANEAAELALRQDSDRLKLDAGLAAVRIAEVRVERAAPIAEAHRADMGGQPSSQQSPQQQGSQPGSPWQNNSQNMGQPQGQQGRWQPRENNGFGPKSSNDPAVLNHAQAPQGGGDAVRARYA